MLSRIPKKPIENQKTAAWSNRERLLSRIAKTAQPSLQQTINAKEYVDTNQK